MATPFQVEENLQKLLDLYPNSENFREALRNISRTSREDAVRLWLTEGVPFAFRSHPSAYEEMRRWLGKRLNACPKEITVVGSARIGFSLAKNKFGHPFNDQSDLDLVAVSESLFGEIAETFVAWKKDYAQKQIQPRNERERSFWDQNLGLGDKHLSLGFFDANKIPTFNRYPLVQRIQDAMWGLTKKLEVTPNVPSPKRASIRIYRTWERLVYRASFNLLVALST